MYSDFIHQMFTKTFAILRLPANGEIPDEGADAEYSMQTHMSVVQGKRHTASLSLLQDPGSRMVRLLVARGSSRLSLNAHHHANLFW